MKRDIELEEAPAPKPHSPLDLFAFPSETRGWFRLLVVAALLVGLNVGILTVQRMYGSSDADERNKLHVAIDEMMGDRDLRDLSPGEIGDLGRKLSPLAWEMFHRRLPRLGTSCIFALLLVAGATVVYGTHPGRFRRCHGSRPLGEDEAPRVVRYLRLCAASLGLPPLKLEYRTGYGNEAQTFGLRGQEVLLLHGIPSLLESSWSDTSKAIALHELGHVKNSDAQDREKTKAIWIALLGLLLLVLCVLAVLTLLDFAGTWRTRGFRASVALLAEIGPPLLQAGWRLGAMLLLVRVIWMRLVRTREFYADRRVASWGLESALNHLLRLPDAKTAWWEAAEKRWGHWPLWRRLPRALDGLAEQAQTVWRPHPSNRLRHEVLADPARLFRVSPILSFVTGVLLSIATVNLIFPLVEVVFGFGLATSAGFWQDLVPYFLSIPDPWGRRLLLSAVVVQNMGKTLLLFSLALGAVSYLLVGTLGIQVQREAVADLAAGDPRTWGYGRLLWPAALLTLGLETGFFIAPFSSGLEFSLGADTLIFWLTGLTCFTWLWLAYVRALTRFTIGMHVGDIPPLRLRRVVTGSSVALLTVLYWPVGFARLAPRISLWTRFARWSPEADPREVFVYSVVITGIILALAAIVVYVVWAGVSLAAVFNRLRRRRPQCPACGDPVSLGFALGRSCSFCREPLAAWAHAGETFDPTIDQKGSL